jgi:chromate transporter
LTDVITLFFLVFKASLLSSGGHGNLPSIHQDLVTRGWSGDAQFVGALAVGQVAPGPGGLWIVALAYLIAGIPGAVVTTLAVVLPPILIFPVNRIYSRFGRLALTQGFVDGTLLVVAATVPMIYVQIMGFDARALAIAAVSFAALASRRLPLFVVMSLGVVVGILLFG